MCDSHGLMVGYIKPSLVVSSTVGLYRLLKHSATAWTFLPAQTLNLEKLYALRGDIVATQINLTKLIKYIAVDAGSYCSKSGTYSDQISVHFGSVSQNVLKSDLKKSRICPMKTFLTDVRFGSKVGQIGPKWDKSSMMKRPFTSMGR